MGKRLHTVFTLFQWANLGTPHSPLDPSWESCLYNQNYTLPLLSSWGGVLPMSKEYWSEQHIKNEFFVIVSHISTCLFFVWWWWWCTLDIYREDHTIRDSQTCMDSQIILSSWCLCLNFILADLSSFLWLRIELQENLLFPNHSKKLKWKR